MNKKRNVYYFDYSPANYNFIMASRLLLFIRGQIKI